MQRLAIAIVAACWAIGLGGLAGVLDVTGVDEIAGVAAVPSHAWAQPAQPAQPEQPATSAGDAPQPAPSTSPEPDATGPVGELPDHAVPMPPPQTPVRIVDRYRPSRGSGFWTSSRPAVGGSYRYRIMAVGVAVLALTAVIMLIVIRTQGQRAAVADAADDSAKAGDDTRAEAAAASTVDDTP
jgi:hypothetical protein